MPGILHAAAAKINADTAGLTNDAKKIATTAPPTILEGIGHDLAFVNGGHHLVDLTVQPLEKATESVRGNLGGLIPRRHSNQAPGPTGGTNAAGGTGRR